MNINQTMTIAGWVLKYPISKEETWKIVYVFDFSPCKYI